MCRLTLAYISLLKFMYSEVPAMFKMHYTPFLYISRLWLIRLHNIRREYHALQCPMRTAINNCVTNFARFSNYGVDELKNWEMQSDQLYVQGDLTATVTVLSRGMQHWWKFILSYGYRQQRKFGKRVSFFISRLTRPICYYQIFMVFRISF